MKSLQNYIFEKYNTYRVKNLEITYNVITKNDYIIFKVPDFYSEDDFQIYIQDMYFKDLPGSEDYSEDFFGKNSVKIFDVLFEYDKYEKSDKEPNDYIDFDINYDNKISEDTKYNFISIKGLKYIIKFDEFDVKDENVEDIENTLIDIFKRCENSQENDWPLEIKLDEKNIKYK